MIPKNLLETRDLKTIFLSAVGINGPLVKKTEVLKKYQQGQTGARWHVFHGASLPNCFSNSPIRTCSWI